MTEAQRPEDKRRHPRIETNLRGRYMLSDRREFPCTIADVALGGIAVAGPERGAIGETVVVYMDQLGRVEGEVVRHLEGGFALQLTITTRATEKFARRLAELQAGDRLKSVSERRREPRVRLDDEVGSLTPPVSAKGTECEIIDLSLTGAHIKIGRRPPIGTLVQLGRVRGRVVRHSPQGVAIDFVDAKKTDSLSDHLVQIVLSTSRRDDAA
jgi:hypothetical protein